MKTYTPKPLDVSRIEIPEFLTPLIEALAENNHDIWAQRRVRDGWSFGPERNDAAQKHPCLVPYAGLPEAEKEYDRLAAIGTIKAILSKGYRIERM